MPSMFSVSKASVSNRLQRSVASFQCQSRRCLLILRYNIASSLTARHQLLEPFFLRERFLLSMRRCFKDCFRNCGLCIFSPVESVKYASFIPNCASGTICLCFTLSAPTLSPVVGISSVEVSSVRGYKANSLHKYHVLS